MIHSLPFLRDITEKKPEYYEKKQDQLKQAGNEERTQASSVLLLSRWRAIVYRPTL